MVKAVLLDRDNTLIKDNGYTFCVDDLIWGKDVIEAGYKIIYEPDAPVYHYHGINHDLNSDRARSIIKILETLNTTKTKQSKIKPQNLKIAAIIPIRGKSKKINGKSLLEITINSTKKYKYVNWNDLKKSIQ